VVGLSSEFLLMSRVKLLLATEVCFITVLKGLFHIYVKKLKEIIKNITRIHKPLGESSIEFPNIFYA
jgi:hypothetical protein